VSAGDWLDSVPGVLRDESLARHSQFGVGGPARWFSTTRDIAVLADLLRRCHESGVPVTMLGAGSNTLISDAGIDGLVIRHNDRRMRVVDAETIDLGAGAMMPRVALDCATRGLAGIEFGIGVPGTLGASVYGNAGAFGSEMSDVLIECTSLDQSGSAMTLTAEACDFSYRSSRFTPMTRRPSVNAPMRSRPSARLRSHTAFAASAASSKTRRMTRRDVSSKLRASRAGAPVARRSHRSTRTSSSTSITREPRTC
jgi:UDP-N-acetylenolpyruvoylglucosamine reductase